MSNVPKLRFKEFNDVLEIKKLKEIIISNTYGPRFNANDYNINGNVKTIRGTDVTLNGNITYNQVPTAQLDEKFIENHILQDGDLVMITTADCGLTGIYEEQKEQYICSAYAVKITLDKALTFPHYFKYFFQTILAKNEVNKYIRKATVANLPASDILRISHKLPRKQEQEKIASFLTSVDTKIEQLTHKEELLQQYKKGVMQKIFNQEIRFKADDGSEFEEWEEKKLSYYLQIPNNKKPTTISKDKLLTVKLHQKGIHINENTDSLSLGASYYIRKKGQFIYGKQNLFNGAFAIVPKELDGYLTSTDVPSLDFNISVINPYFFTFYLGRKSFYKRLEIYASGTGSKRIHENILLDLKTIFPSLEEQTKIANFLSSIDSKIEQVQQQLNSTKEFKKALLQQMFV